MVCDVHRLDLDCIVIAILGEWLDRQDWDVCCCVHDNDFAEQLLTELRRNSAEGDEHSYQLIVVRPNQLIDFGMVLGRAVGKLDLDVASCL